VVLFGSKMSCRHCGLPQYQPRETTVSRPPHEAQLRPTDTFQLTSVSFQVLPIRILEGAKLSSIPKSSSKKSKLVRYS